MIGLADKFTQVIYSDTQTIECSTLTVDLHTRAEDFIADLVEWRTRAIYFYTLAVY